MSKETIVIDLGGSILAPKLGQINLRLLKRLRALLKKESKKKRFAVVVGGGSTARNYQKNARDLKVRDHQSLDWIGIRATQLNAEFLKAYLGDLASPQLITSEEEKDDWKKGILVSGGWHPGNSTDYITLRLAETYQAAKVIIATNIDYVYDSDPKKNPRAKRFENIGWNEFHRLFNQKWEPGMTVPLDPKAAKLGKKLKIPLYFLDGNDLANLEKAISGENFRGTVVR